MVVVQCDVTLIIFAIFFFIYRTLEKLNVGTQNQLSGVMDKRKQEEEEINQLVEDIEVRIIIPILGRKLFNREPDIHCGYYYIF